MTGLIDLVCGAAAAEAPAAGGESSYEQLLMGDPSTICGCWSESAALGGGDGGGPLNGALGGVGAEATGTGSVEFAGALNGGVGEGC